MTTIFLHIHKTGGTSLSHALRWGTQFARRHWTEPGDSWAKSYQDLSEKEREQVDLLQGHFLYGIHEHCPGPATYIAMVRHPVERIISSYYYTIDTFPDTYIQEMTLEAFAAGESIHRECNAQARRIAGVSKDEAESVSSEGLFDRAIHNIEDHFACVGLLKRFDESLMLMRHLLEWSFYPLYLREKETTDRPRGNDIPSSTREAIRRSNEVDMRLYDFVVGRFDEQIKSQPRIERDVSRFRKLNCLYQKIAPWFVEQYRRLR